MKASQPALRHLRKLNKQLTLTIWERASGQLHSKQVVIKVNNQLSTDNKKVNLLAQLAIPQLIRRKVSGRYTMRLREVGSVSSLVSVGLRTTNRYEATERMNHLAMTAKAFLLDNPQATSGELNEHLKGLALSFLTDKVEDYWHGLDVDQLGDAAADLKTLAQGSLSLNQQAHIVNALEVLKAAQDRVNDGHGQALLSVMQKLDNQNDSAVYNLESGQGDSPIESTEKRLAGTQVVLNWGELSSTYQAEHSVNLKPASQRDIQSAHKTLSRFVKEIDWKTHTRAEVSAVRDAMRESGLADSTVNKLLAKLCAVMNWASQNGYVPHDYTKGLKVKGVESKRRAFSEDELVKVVATIADEREISKRLFGTLAVITGARAGELTQLTKADVVSESGYVCVDINANGDKTLKTKASARVVPLTDGAYGLDLREFTEFVSGLPSDDSLVFGMSRDVGSKWFNETVLPKALLDRTGDLVLHSLRHTMATMLKQSECAESVAQDVLGHSAQSITFGRYGKAKSVKLMAEALSNALIKLRKTL